MFAESKLLFKLWLKNPLKIGAVTASSPELAAAMAKHIPAGDGYVVELGGGTGPVTRAILAAGTPPGRLVVVERDATLHRVLCERYPSVRVILGDAMHLQSLLRKAGIDQVKAVVSGLPLLSMKKAVQYRIGAQAFAVLQPSAPFIQFTYGLFSPLPHRRLGVQGAVKDRVLQNLPPASVWLYRKPARHQETPQSLRRTG
ncbi:MAG: ribose ABC transporter permease [Dongiaceae bacterium]